jgi:hypothetical protein
MEKTKPNLECFHVSLESKSFWLSSPTARRASETACGLRKTQKKRNRAKDVKDGLDTCAQAMVNSEVRPNSRVRGPQLGFILEEAVESFLEGTD